MFCWSFAEVSYGEYRFSIMFLSFIIMSHTGSYSTSLSLLEDVSFYKIDKYKAVEK